VTGSEKFVPLSDDYVMSMLMFLYGSRFRK